ncbi:MAG: hypothetical protein NVSMB45_01080 [Ginsengibacter sp.]
MNTLNSPGSLPFDTLTPLLQKTLNPIAGDERELLLYSTLSTVSGILTSVTGQYNKREVYPMLYFLLEALPASGKGVMMYAKDLVTPIQYKIKNESDAKLTAYRRQLKSKGAAGLLKPPYQVPLIPGNCSSAKLIQHLADNSPDVPSIMIESEMDTITQINNSDFGNYSDILRKAFHHEYIALSRRGGDEYMTVDKPKLAIAISGTPGQLKKFISNTEDGLLSRFMMLRLTETSRVDNVAPCPTCEDLSKYYTKMSGDYYKLWEHCLGKNLIIQLTSEQWQHLQEFLEVHHSEVIANGYEYAASIVKRHGLILYKLCMVLTTIRYFDEQQNCKEIFCTDDDFKTALYLSKKSLDCSLEFFESLPAAKNVAVRKEDNVQYILKNIKDEFVRADIIPLCTLLKISVRTLDRYLKEMLDKGVLSQDTHGKYKKLQKEQAVSNCQLSNSL